MSPKIYDLFIENPKTDLEKKIEGRVIISFTGSKSSGIGEISGFPDEKTIKVGPIESTFSYDLNFILEEVIFILINQIQFQYNVDLTGRLKSVGHIREAVESTPSSSSNEIINNNVLEKEKIILNDITFKIDINNKIIGDKLGILKIIEKVDTSILSGFDFGDDQDLSLLDDEFIEDDFLGSEELSIEMEERTKIQEDVDLGPPDNTTLPEIDFNNTSFVGAEWKSFNIDKVINEIEKTKHRPSSLFKESLKNILFLIKNDPLINDIREAAYLLATAYGEAGYSLQRWEADYSCKLIGVKYGSGGPCQAALNYYRKSDGKQNYYNLGTDKKGLPYFGRGLIQLTGKANYEKYGKKLGLDLVNNADLAMVPQNSYKIAVSFLTANTFQYLKDPNKKRCVTKNNQTTCWTGLNAARRSVNGGENGINEINSAYADWLKIFKDLIKIA
jgi:predicted chitinase